MPETGIPPSPRRWLMVGFAFAATAINYLDRQTLSVAAPVLRAQFHLSNVSYSRVLFCFLLAYTLMNGLSGGIIDRLGSKLGYALCVGVWSVAAALHATVAGVVGLGVFRCLLGAGEAGNWPAGVKVVSEWFPAKERALAAGIFNGGAAFGAILAPPLIAWIILQYSWRAAFGVVGALGLIWVALWLALYRPPPQPDGERKTPAIPLRQLIRSRFVLGFMLAKIFIDPVWYFYTFWFPEYLKTARGFDLAHIGRLAWIPFAIAGLGNVLGGTLSGVLLRHGVSVTGARKAAVTCFAVLMTAAIPAVLVQSWVAALALVSVAMLGYTGATANMLAMPADVFPKEAVASVYGLASMGSGFGGMLFTLATGWLVDRYSYVPVFVIAGIMPLVCAAIIWGGLGRLEPAARRA